MDLATYRLSEPWRTPVFRSERLARASFDAEHAKQRRGVFSSEVIAPSSITPEGQDLLDQAREVDMMTAIFRNRVINPDHYHDDEQVQVHGSCGEPFLHEQNVVGGCSIEKQRASTEAA